MLKSLPSVLLLTAMILACGEQAEPLKKQGPVSPADRPGSSPDPAISPEVLPSLSIVPEEITLALPGGREQLQATLLDSNAPVYWFSSNGRVAGVSHEGLVSAVGPGTTFIMALASTEGGILKSLIRVTVEPNAERPMREEETPPTEPVSEEESSPVEPIAEEEPPVEPAPENPPPAPDDEEAPPTEPLEGCHPDLVLESGPPSSEAPFADEVVSYRVGRKGGFHRELLPEIVIGPPHGAGNAPGGRDVFSLGLGGEIVLEFSDFIAVDGPGPDLIVFENSFSGFFEPAAVLVSEDGVTWHEFPCERGRPFTGCAGGRPVYANPDLNDIDPTDPDEAGGDAYDLQEVGLCTARFVKIVDIDGCFFYGDQSHCDDSVVRGILGFDLDAVSIVHGRTP